MTPAISEPRGHLSADPLRVLVLEDNPADAELILRELRRAGYEVSSRRTDSEDGFLKLLDPLPQLILADYTMPTFDALSALRLLRERDLDIPFIIVSGMIGEDVAVFAMRNGAADYLFKDRLARLGPAVTNALEQKRLRDAKWKSAERMIDDLRRLNRAVHAVHAERGPQVLQRIADVTRNLAAADFSVLALLRHDQSEFETFTVSAATSLFGSKPPKPTGIWRLAIEKARALRFSDVRSHPDSGLPKDLTVGPLLLLPLIRESEVIGILAVGRAAGAEPFDEHDNELLAQLAEHVLLAVQYVPYLRRIIGRGARGEKSRRTLEAAFDLRSAAGRGSGRKRA